MATRETGEQVEARLQELYRRHLALDEERVVSYYDAARAYYGPESAGPERDRFAISLATIEDELYQAGDWV